jgi:hypothetical protein
VGAIGALLMAGLQTSGRPRLILLGAVALIVLAILAGAAPVRLQRSDLSSGDLALGGVYIVLTVIGVLAIGLALFQFWGEWHLIGAVAVIFVVGQMVEGNVLTPKLVGESVGLHPVWLLLALSVFGTLFGFVGMLVAVPVSAALGVLARFGTEQYQQSILYKGRAGLDDTE